MIFEQSDEFPVPLTGLFASPVAGPVWEGSDVRLDFRPTDEVRSTSNTPFFVRVIGSGSGREYEVVSNGGVVRDGWEGSNLAVTGLDTESSLGTNTAIWMNFPVSGGVASGGSIEVGSSMPSEVVTSGSGSSITQTALNVLVWQEDSGNSVQVLSSNLRVFSTPIATLHTVVALPST